MFVPRTWPSVVLHPSPGGPGSNVFPMARPRKTQGETTKPEGKPRLTVPRAQLEEALNQRIQEGILLEHRAIQSEKELDEARADYYTWTEYNETLLHRSFTTDEVAARYKSSGGAFMIYDKSLAQEIEEFREDVRMYARRLKSVLEQLPLYDDELPAPGAAPTRLEGSTGTTIFLVHGHAEAQKLAIHGFLRQVTTLDVVILHDQASEGRTIIEKFEDHAGSAAFAVVILTGDDEGRLRGGDEEPPALQPRARQNVIFEFGFFVAALGRKRVAILHDEGAELPSDIDGLLYIPLDPAGGWKLLLARELDAAQIQVDTKKMLS
jgi:predicted nucleotide-binding protein